MWARRSSMVALALSAGACTTGFEGFDVASPDGGSTGGAATATASSSAAVGGGGGSATSSGSGTGGVNVDGGSPGGGGATGGTGGLGSGGEGGAPPTSCDAQYMSAQGYVLCQELRLSCEFNLDAMGMTSCDDVCHELGGECLYAGDNGDDCRYTVGTAQCADGNWSTVLCGCSRGCGLGPPCTAGKTCTMGLCL